MTHAAEFPALRRTARRAFAFAAATCAAACASARSGEPVPANGMQWTARLRAPRLPTASTVRSPGATATSYGSVTATPDPAQAGRSVVDVSIYAPSMVGRDVAWAIFMGPCGAASLPAAVMQEFPTISISTSGGRARARIMMDLEPRTEYHVNVYYSSRATEEGNVMLCGNLDYHGPR